MRLERTLVSGVLVVFTACSHSPAEPSSAGEASAAKGAAGPPSTIAPAPPLTATVAVGRPVDRAGAEAIALAYARVRWPEWDPDIATAFDLGDGEYRVVVGFEKRADAASVFVRATDGTVVDASIAPGDH